jgi:hypothetical protein
MRTIVKTARKNYVNDCYFSHGYLSSKFCDFFAKSLTFMLSSKTDTFITSNGSHFNTHMHCSQAIAKSRTDNEVIIERHLERWTENHALVRHAVGREDRETKGMGGQLPAHSELL